jgi:phage major head subunit gpT-like protein
MSVNVEAASNRIFQEYQTRLLKALDDAPRVASAYAMEVPSSSRSSLHAWLANQSSVKEWLGRRKLNSFGTRHWEVVNRNWELSYSFDVNQIADDLSGLVAEAVMAARQNGAKWARHEDLLCASTLEAGNAATCYDGQFFFDSDHPTDLEGLTSGTFDNTISGALSHSTVYSALKKLMSYKNMDGSPMVPPGAKVKLMTPPALMDRVDSILYTKSLTPATAYALFGTGGASENPLYQRMEGVTNQYLTSDTVWYVVAEVDGIKPIMFQRRQGIETAEQGPGSQLYFDEKKVAIGTDSRYEASFTHPQLALRGAP